MLAITFIFSISINAASLQLKGDLLTSRSELSPNTQQLLQSKFQKYDIFNMNSGRAILKPGFQNLDLSINLAKEKKWQFNLEKRNLLSPNYLKRGLNKSGINIYRTSLPETYKITDSPNGLKGRVSFDGISMTAMIREGEELLFVEPLTRIDPFADSNLVVIYNSRDVIQEKGFCSTDDEFAPEPLALELKKVAAKPKSADCRRVRIAFIVVNSFLKHYGSIPAAETRILEILNATEELYAPFDIKYTVTEMLFEEEELNTWGPQIDIPTYVVRLREWLPDNLDAFVNDYDALSFWYRDTESIGSYGEATTPGICGVLGRDLSMIREYTDHFMGMVFVLAHELGHNWSGIHVNGNGAPHIMHFSTLIEPTSLEWSNATSNRILNYKNTLLSRGKCLMECGIAPEARFNFHSNPCRSQVDFLDRSTNDPTKWEWDFGDGNKSVEQNPQHIFEKNGSYMISLSVQNEFGVDTLIKSEPITIDAPEPPQISSQCGGNSVTLTGTSPGVVRWYDQAYGGEPIYTGQNFDFSLPNSDTIIFVESGTNQIECMSPRIPITITPSCDVTTQVKNSKELFNLSEIRKLGLLQSIEVRDVRGRLVVSMNLSDTNFDFTSNISSYLSQLPNGKVYWIQIMGKKGALIKKWTNW